MPTIRVTPAEMDELLKSCGGTLGKSVAETLQAAPARPSPSLASDRAEGRQMTTKRKRAAPRASQHKAKLSDDVLFVAACVAHGIPTPEAEWRFHSKRRWRFDFAWPWSQTPVALEIEGGIWNGGRHTRGKGFLGDIEKYNTATLLGWRVLRCTPKEVKSGAVFELLRRALA